MALIYKVSQWIERLIILNAIWLLFTIVGLGVFGLFPATAACFAVTRKWLNGESDLSIFKTAWSYFKQDFVKANILGYGSLAFGVFLFVDYQIFRSMAHPILNNLHYIFLLLMFIHFLGTLYIFPVFVHYDFKLWESFKHAFILVIARPMQTIAMLLGFILLYVFFNEIRFLIPFIGAGAAIMSFMAIAMISFPKVERSVTQ